MNQLVQLPLLSNHKHYDLQLFVNSELQSLKGSVPFTFLSLSSPINVLKAQLNRRLSKSLAKELNRADGFNFDSVTVGTEFMHRLHLKFEMFVESLRAEKPRSYPDRKIEYSR